MLVPQPVAGSLLDQIQLSDQLVGLKIIDADICL